MSEIATRPPQQQLAAQVRSETFQEQLGLILDESERKRFTRLAVTAVLTNPQIAEDLTDLNSFFSALLACAAEGLIPDGKQAAIIIRKGKASFQPMVDGLRQQAGEYGWTVRARVVYANDSFDYTDEPPVINHVRTRAGIDNGGLIAAYAIAEHHVLPRQQLVMYAHEIQKRRDKATTQAVWNEWPEEMWEKTVVKALVNDLPKPERFRVDRVLAAELDPGDSAARFYGPQAREVFEDPPAEGGPRPADAATAPVSDAGGEGQQAADAGTLSPRASAAPDPDYAARNAEAAGRVVVPAGAKYYVGIPIGSVHAAGQEGIDFLAACVKKARAWEKPDQPDGELRRFSQALRAYCEVELPEFVGKERAA